MTKKTNLFKTIATILLGAGLMLAAEPTRSQSYEPGTTPPGADPTGTHLAQSCSSGTAWGVAFDGTYLWYSCAGTTEALFKADPKTGCIVARYSLDGAHACHTDADCSGGRPCDIHATFRGCAYNDDCNDMADAYCNGTPENPGYCEIRTCRPQGVHACGSDADCEVSGKCLAGDQCASVGGIGAIAFDEAGTLWAGWGGPYDQGLYYKIEPEPMKAICCGDTAPLQEVKITPYYASEAFQQGNGVGVLVGLTTDANGFIYLHDMPQSGGTSTIFKYKRGLSGSPPVEITDWSSRTLPDNTGDLGGLAFGGGEMYRVALHAAGGVNDMIWATNPWNAQSSESDLHWTASENLTRDLECDDQTWGTETVWAIQEAASWIDGKPRAIAYVAPGCKSGGGTGLRPDPVGNPLLPACGDPPPVTDTCSDGPVVETSHLPLWPPDHTMRTVSLSDCVTGAYDPCTATSLDIAAVGSILRVESDELEKTKGSGMTCNDIVLGDRQTVSLRAERAGNLNGRVYTLYFEVLGPQGNKSLASCSVVPVFHNAGTDMSSELAAAITDSCAYCVGADCGTCPGHDPTCK